MSKQDNLPVITGDQLPAIYGGATFVEPERPGYNIDPEVRAAMEADGTAEKMNAGFETPRAGIMFNIVVIRQPNKVVKGTEPGDFMITYDPTNPDGEIMAPDVSAEDGLLVSVLKDKLTRAYWPKFEGGTPPQCKSMDCRVGAGDPGGSCTTCQWNPFAIDANGESLFKGDDKNKCKSMNNLFCFDYNGKVPLILRLGPSSLKAWDATKLLSIKKGTPYLNTLFKVTTREATDKELQGRPMWHVFVFEPVGEVSLPIYQDLKQLEQRAGEFEEVAQVVTDEDGTVVKDMQTGDPGGEVPPGVDPIPGHSQVAKQTPDDDPNLPF